MKTLIASLLLCLGLGVSANAQIKALSYNSTNGNVIGTGLTNPLTFSNSLAFGTATLANQTRTNLGLGAPWLTNTAGGSSFLNQLFATNIDYPSDFAGWAAANIYSISRSYGLLDVEDGGVTALSYASVGTNRWTVLDGNYLLGALVGYDASITTFDEYASTLLDVQYAFGIIDGNASVPTTVFSYNSGQWFISNAPSFRNELGLSAPWLTNTNVTNFRTAIGFSASVVGGNSLLSVVPTPMPTNTLITWDITNNVTSVGGSVITYGATNISASDFTAGSGTTSGNTTTPAGTWNRTYISNSDPLTAQGNNSFVSWTTTVSNGSTLVINGFTGLNLAKTTSAGPTSADLFYSISGGPFVKVGNTFAVASVQTSAASTFNAGLANRAIVVAGGTTITWRLVPYSGLAGRFGIGNTSTNDVSILGYVIDGSNTNTYAFQPLSSVLTALSQVTNGLTATKSFITYDGVNFTTQTVTISNGIITGWTP